MKKQFFIYLLAIILISCNDTPEIVENSQCNTVEEIEAINLLTEVDPIFEDGEVNAIIEIPTGTNEKWELNKSSGEIEWEEVNGKPRVVDYLGYPGNYGFIPQSLLSKDLGGDGDPLDIIVLGPAIERGSVVKSKIIGVIYLLDRGEQDDKLIAVTENTPFYEVNSIAELEEKFKGTSQILELWFTNYKGPGKIITNGFGEAKEANEIVRNAISQFEG